MRADESPLSEPSLSLKSPAAVAPRNPTERMKDTSSFTSAAHGLNTSRRQHNRRRFTISGRIEALNERSALPLTGSEVAILPVKNLLTVGRCCVTHALRIYGSWLGSRALDAGDKNAILKHTFKINRNLKSCCVFGRKQV